MAKLTWLPKKTFELEFSLPWEEVKKTYDAVVVDLVKTAKIEGFRPGKAPKEMVEKQADKGRLYGEVINRLLPQSYTAAIKQHGLRPVISPKITIVRAEENKSWEFQASACELPEIVLGNYIGICRGALVKSKLETKELTPTEKFKLIAKALIEEIKIEISDLLIESERDRMLSRLLEQTEKLGLTIDRYAASINKSVTQIREEYHKTAANTLKLELILQAVADEKKFVPDSKEVDKLAKTE